MIFFLQNLNADKKKPIFVQGSNLRIQIMPDCLEFSIQILFLACIQCISGIYIKLVKFIYRVYFVNYLCLCRIF